MRPLCNPQCHKSFIDHKDVGASMAHGIWRQQWVVTSYNVRCSYSLGSNAT